jgi:hypothetical protein
VIMESDGTYRAAALYDAEKRSCIIAYPHEFLPRLYTDFVDFQDWEWDAVYRPFVEGLTVRGEEEPQNYEVGIDWYGRLEIHEIGSDIWNRLDLREDWPKAPVGSLAFIQDRLKRPLIRRPALHFRDQQWREEPGGISSLEWIVDRLLNLRRAALR